MLAGDREHVGKAASFTGVEMVSRLPVISADALVDGLAHAIHGRGVAQPQTGRARRLSSADAAEHEARGADALEICSDLRDCKHLGCVNEPKTTQIGTDKL